MNLCTTLHYKKSKMDNYSCILKTIGAIIKNRMNLRKTRFSIQHYLRYSEEYAQFFEFI